MLLSNEPSEFLQLTVNWKNIATTFPQCFKLSALSQEESEPQYVCVCVLLRVRGGPYFTASGCSFDKMPLPERERMKERKSERASEREKDGGRGGQMYSDSLTLHVLYLNIRKWWKIPNAQKKINLCLICCVLCSSRKCRKGLRLGLWESNFFMDLWLRAQEHYDYD